MYTFLIFEIPYFKSSDEDTVFRILYFLLNFSDIVPTNRRKKPAYFFRHVFSPYILAYFRRRKIILDQKILKISRVILRFLNNYK